MNKVLTALCATAMLAASAQAGVAVNVGVDNNASEPWLGFMNVFELDGSTFVFGSGWGIADLTASFDDGAGTVTMGPNVVGDPDPFWYQGGGAPGAPGNKVMEANMYQEVSGGSLSGVTVNFSGVVLSQTLTDAHEARVFVRDFAADYSSVVETFADLDAAGAFSVSLDTIDDDARHVQWGIQVKGVNVWATDVAPFGTIVIGTIPTPGSFALLGLAGLTATRRRRA